MNRLGLRIAAKTPKLARRAKGTPSGLLFESVFTEIAAPSRVIACFAETGQTDKIVLYSKKVGYTPDFIGLLQHIMRTNPEKGAEFAAQLVNNEDGPLVDVERVRLHTTSTLHLLLMPHSILGGGYFHVTEHDSAGDLVLA